VLPMLGVFVGLLLVLVELLTTWSP
jgi:hypothetical protein